MKAQRQVATVREGCPTRTGGASYATPAASDAIHPALARLAAAFVPTTEGVGPLLAVKTPAGSATVLASAIDPVAEQLGALEELFGSSG